MLKIKFLALVFDNLVQNRIDFIKKVFVILFARDICVFDVKILCLIASLYIGSLRIDTILNGLLLILLGFYFPVYSEMRLGSSLHFDRLFFPLIKMSISIILSI